MPDSPLRILIVDDEAPARRRLRDLLEDCAAALPLVGSGSTWITLTAAGLAMGMGARAEGQGRPTRVFQRAAGRVRHVGYVPASMVASVEAALAVLPVPPVKAVRK